MQYEVINEFQSTRSGEIFVSDTQPFKAGDDIGTIIRINLYPLAKTYSYIKVSLLLDSSLPYTVYHILKSRYEIRYSHRLYHNFKVPATLNSDGNARIQIERYASYRDYDDISPMAFAILWYRPNATI